MLFLDTSAYSALANGQNDIVSLIDSEYNLALPLPVIAELRYGFLKGSRPTQNEENLMRFLAQPQVEIVLPTINTTYKYAEMCLYCVKKAKVLSHNDLWIAAIAKENTGVLVTFDKDFEALKAIFSDKLIVLNAS
jgi:predicted nucleic acid-binding protein